MDDQEQAHAQDAKRCTCAALPEPPNDDCSIHGLCETCGAEPDGKCMFPTSSGIDPCRTVPPAPLTPAGCSGVDRDDIAERIDDRFEEVSYGLASQIGDEILKHFKVEKR
jgi:hypothetical protein